MATSFQIGEYCFRISAYEETLEAADRACEAEGAFLAYIPDNFVQNELREEIERKKSKYDHFAETEHYWLGAYLTRDYGTEFEWKYYDFPMATYSNWRSGIKGASS